jgi:hypothetical protein
MWGESRNEIGVLGAGDGILLWSNGEAVGGDSIFGLRVLI